MRVTPIEPTLKVRGTIRLKLKCDEPLSNFAFKYNLRHYNAEEAARLEREMTAKDKLAEDLRGEASEAGAYTRPPFSST
jgi:hypothetical protein